MPGILMPAVRKAMGDVMSKGGITSMLKIAHLAKAYAMKLEIYHGSNSLNDVANRHLQMAIPNTRFMEVLLPHEAWWHELVETLFNVPSPSHE